MHSFLLKRIPLFSGIRDTDLNRLSKILAPIHVEKDNVIVMEAERGKALLSTRTE